MADSEFYGPIRRLCSEMSWLREEFFSPSSDQVCRQSQLVCEMVIVRMQDAWARFCRELIILSALGNGETLGGIPLKPSLPVINNRASVIPALLSTYKRRQYEPRWERADECIEAGQRLSILNLPTVSSALGATNSPAEAMRHVRNFYAHRKQGTARNAILTGCFAGSRYPVVFALRSYTTGGGTVLDSWINGLIIVATAAAQ